MEIIDGDAKGTKITQKFSNKDSVTTIHTVIEFELEGILSTIGFVPKGNLEHAANTILTSFIDYSQISEDPTKQTIDDLYREILLRPADTEAFEYWGSMLESEIITKQELRKNILKSDEALSLKLFNAETKQMINDIFNEILDRDPSKSEASHYKYLIDIEEITEEEMRSELKQHKENEED